MLVSVLSYEVGLPNGKMIEVDGYDDCIEIITQYNEENDLVDGEICFPDLFDFVNTMLTTNSKMEVVVNNVVLGTISKVIKKEEI